ncbi:sensor histidine kinase [Kitasatospora purpeofusca]|uniref:sensor histidine kinase n=1 Tax=Kitasatospora purpeofusca TaxID=67352 RepID=UPI00225312C0|nr:GAF domain-containing protein [Kitasatospora purpeofusca]MCX4753928.1 GAF domain-containing protein [Kitasatospora purpeofusca]WSR33392.1 GAF domain-containing protein [Kitasatospora purpeofusca]WSR41474.1 GAF domain-containing protein [Kitasatospora purpeofusca]
MDPTPDLPEPAEPAGTAVSGGAAVPGDPEADQAPHRVPEISSLGLDTLVTEVAERLQSAAAVTDRMQRLLEAVVSVGSGLDLHATLHRIATGAAELVDARYAALGVIAPNGQGLSDFIHVGVDDAVAARIGELPVGRGILGALIDRPEPLRLTELGADPRSYGFPPHHPEMKTFLGEPIRIRDEVFGNLYLTEKKGGGAFTPEDEQVVHALAAAAGVAIENSRLYEEGRRRERWIAGAAAVTTALLSRDEAEIALTVAAEQVRELADAALGMILLPVADEDAGTVRMRVAHASGEAAEFVRGELLPPDSFAARLLAGESVHLDDMSTDPTVVIRLARSFGPSLAVPMVAARRVLGGLCVWRPRGALPFTDGEKQLAETFASQAALALRLAEGQRDQQRLAVFQDRDRIARDLHDLVIQRLFATGMMLEGAARRAVVPEVKVRIGEAVDELDATIQEVRTTIYALQHDDHGDAPDTLRTRVLRECSQTAAALGFKPSVSFVGPVESLVGEKTGRQLLAALREMLSNAARHARASRVGVEVDATVHLDDDGRPVGGDPESLDRGGRPGVLLTVTDDGVGIPEGGRRSGLRNLTRRAEALGGDAWHEPGPYGRGTRVRWTARL